MIVTDEQWQKVLDKYEKLMFTISHNVGGDKVTNDFDDTVQEVSITAMEAIETFGRKTGKTFDEFWGTVEFDKYIKTCMWNKKNNLGNKINKKLNIRRCVSLDVNITMPIEEYCGDSVIGSRTDSAPLQYPTDVSSVGDNPFFGVDFDETTNIIVKAIMSDAKMIKPSGKINISKLATLLNKPKSQIKHTVSRLETVLKDYNEV